MEYISREAVNDLIEDMRNNHFILMCERINLSLLKSKVAEIPAADVQPFNQWISIKDKLPNEGERVLIYAPRTQNQYYIAMFYILRDEIKFTMNVYGTSYCWYADNVTHWMPLPEPPKDGETNDSNDK